MVAPVDYDFRQSGRVLELQNRDPLVTTNKTVLALSYPLVYIREAPFRNLRGRPPAKLKAREDKIEETKKQKTVKNGDEELDSTRWQQSSWTWTTPSSSSAWREWSSDVTRERADWQSADWDSSDQAREPTAWRSSDLWQSHFLWQ